MKNNYSGFKGWIKYVKDYKSNIENSHQYADYIDEKSKLQEKLNQTILEKNMYEAEIIELNTKLRNRKIDNIRNNAIIHKLNEEIRTLTIRNQDLASKVIEKELLRRKTAGKVGGLKAKTSVLKKDLARANQKINWLSNNQKAPTKEEILAYELQMKEVEKKLKKDID